MRAMENIKTDKANEEKMTSALSLQYFILTFIVWLWGRFGFKTEKWEVVNLFGEKTLISSETLRFIQASIFSISQSESAAEP